jgi:hypothetical protein
MGDLNYLAEKSASSNYKKIFSIIREGAKGMSFTADGKAQSPIAHSSEEIQQIKNALYEEVRTLTIAGAGKYITLDELQDSYKYDLKKFAKEGTFDGFMNPISGAGTMSDPSMSSLAYTPVMMGPDQVTALYASGGIAQIIIDKKSKGIMLNGFQLLSNKFKAQELQDLKDYAESIGFGNSLSEAVRDGNIYGGSALFPRFYFDDPCTTAMTPRQLIEHKILGKRTISKFTTVDRWNTVVIPNYDVSANDYMNPSSFYVPISGIEVNTQRAALIRPKPMPYWAAIRQLGWGQPDSAGYMRSLLGYQILISCIPMMAQQMSLLIHEIPMDGFIAQNGPDAAKIWQDKNEEELRNWSMFNPKAINSFGKIAVLNRTYAGFEHLVAALRQDVCAQSGLPESVIFFTQPSGIFNKNEEDVMLKQAETIRLGQKTITPAVNGLLPYLAVDLWGLPDGYASWEKYQTLTITFDTPVISSPSVKAEIGRKYAEMIKTFTDSGMDLERAIGMSKQFMGNVELPKDIEAAMSTEPAQKPVPLDKNDSGGVGAAPLQVVKNGRSA